MFMVETTYGAHFFVLFFIVAASLSNSEGTIRSSTAFPIVDPLKSNES